jgi:hypothetical protein
MTKCRDIRARFGGCSPLWRGYSFRSFDLDFNLGQKSGNAWSDRDDIISL